MIRRLTLLVTLLCVHAFASAVNYLTFTAGEDNAGFGFGVWGTVDSNIEYSLDGGDTWNELVPNDTVFIPKRGDKAILRGDNPQGLSVDGDNYIRFIMTDSIAASGSVMSLLDGVGESKTIPNSECFTSLFSGCYSLTQAPELPATTLSRGCYAYMFANCIHLTQAPELPATELVEGCYSGMFFRCTGLTQAPVLPALKVPSGSYVNMFSRCSVLKEAPALPAMELSPLCYEGMFSDCSSLTEAPELPATTLADNCYDKMFQYCTSLTQAPALPATQMVTGCYDRMFMGCTSLTQAPAFLATSLVEDCTTMMFFGCTQLSKIEVHFTKWIGTANWVADVAPTGRFICPKDLAEQYGPSRIPEGWNMVHPAAVDYLTFTAEEENSSFGIETVGDVMPDIQYSLDDGQTWVQLSVGDTVPLKQVGDKALLRGNHPDGFSHGPNRYTNFTMTGSIAASGSVMSLITDEGECDKIPSGYCFYQLFYDCASLTQAPELPATELAARCYMSMFWNCTRLTKAPALPATKMVTSCYDGIFMGCTALTQAPELPATELSDGCYGGMFDGCTALTKAPELPATELPIYCYVLMFTGCTSLTQAPELPATELSEGCYYGMFNGCASLTQAPELHNTDVRADSCCNRMFDGCSNLSLIKVNFTEWTRWTRAWVSGVAPTGTFVCPKSLAEEYGENRIPEGWRMVEPEEWTSTRSVEAAHCDIWSEGLSIFVRNAEGLVAVYNLNGQLLRTAQCTADGTARFVMPAAGVYVVKAGMKSVEVIVGR